MIKYLLAISQKEYVTMQLMLSTHSKKPTVKPKSHIGEQERQKRLTAWKKTAASFALEGIHPTEEMERIGFMYINGEISFEQRARMMKESVLMDTFNDAK